MGGIGRAIGSVLIGAGEGLEKQAESDIETRRQVALENLRAQNRQTELETTADLNDRNAARNDARDYAYNTSRDEQKAAADLEHDIRMKGVDLSNSKALEDFKHAHKLTEIQAQTAADIQREAVAQHTKISRIIFSKNGQAIVYKEDGSSYVRGRPGDFTPSGESYSHSSSDDSDFSVSDELGNRGGGTSPAPAPQAKPTGNSAPSALEQLSHLPPPPGGRVGATATGPNGLRATWNGKQWVLNDVNNG